MAVTRPLFFQKLLENVVISVQNNTTGIQTLPVLHKFTSSSLFEIKVIEVSAIITAQTIQNKSFLSMATDTEYILRYFLVPFIKYSKTMIETTSKWSVFLMRSCSLPMDHRGEFLSGK